MDNIEDFNGEQGADIAEIIADETAQDVQETQDAQETPIVEEYIADAPQLAAPLHSRTAHYGFRRGRV